MKEKLYTIPVNEAFGADCECPLCEMRKKLELDAIDYTMGPSYMEDDVREMTSRLGFCEKHLSQLYQHQNRLGLALILQSYMNQVIKDVEKKAKSGIRFSSPLLSKKNNDPSGIIHYFEKLESSCFICEKIEGTFERYIATVFYLYRHEEEFRKIFALSKGFCSIHYKILYVHAPKYLSGKQIGDFIEELNRLYLKHMKRVSEDLDWFVNKFDYKYADEPWYNAKDALPRAIQKTNGIL